MHPLTIYARKELTTDTATALAQGLERSAGLKPIPRHDVVFYTDPQATGFVGRSPWYYSTTPTRRNKWVTLNCHRYRLAWID